MFFQFRHDFKEIADDAVVCEFENRCIGIFIDGNDQFGILNAQFMLDGTGNTHGDVDFRRNLLARNPDLQIMGSPFVVDEGFGNAEGGSDTLCKFFDSFHAFFVLNAAAGADDDVSRFNGQAFGSVFDSFKVGYFDRRSIAAEIDLFLDDFALTRRISRCPVENLVADRTELRAGRRLDFNQELAREGRTNPSKRIVIAFVEDVDAIGNEADFSI